MFFPCTNKETVEVDYSPKSMSDDNRSKNKESNRSSINQSHHHSVTSDPVFQQVPDPSYLSKPTIIMCNPNALYYQQMVTSPNAYWLNFFLKRDINVVCWNYRGYGESEINTAECVTPYKTKRDAERVFAFVVNNLKMKGKIGVYGRSIGGLAACHLSAMYPDFV